MPCAVGMRAAGQAGCLLHVSEYLFRLTTECIRLYSNETLAYQSLGVLVSARLAVFGSVESLCPDEMREHFTTLPTYGDVPLPLDIPDSDRQALADLREELVRQMGAGLTLADALSALLFEYVVEAKAAHILGRLKRENLLPDSPELLVAPLRH